MTTIQDQPLSKDELRELIRCDRVMATMKNPNTGEFIVRNEQTRREYEIRANAMEFYLDNVEWIDPTA